MPSWYLHTVAVGNRLQAAQSADVEGSAVGATEHGELFAWSGLSVTLYKDACERFWHALIGDKPLVYVVCREGGEDEKMQVRPCIVTIDYDEATANAETDELVLSAPIPPELYRYMEDFVLQHYQPRPFKKRKRRKWSEGDDGGTASGPRDR